MSIADSIIKGTYGNNNTVGIKYSSKKTSIADSIINGSYYETLKKRKKEKEEEQKRIAEQQKLEKEQQVKKQVENVSTYGPTTQTNKVQTVTDKLKKIAPVSNEAIKSNSQIGETQKVTRSDVKAQQKATEINQDLKNGNKASAIGAILNGIPEGIKSGVAKSINALNILGARTFDEQDKKINWMQDEILKDKPNATANRLKDMPSFANRAKNKLLDKAEDLDDRTSMHSKTVSQIENSKVKTAAGVSSSIGEMIPAMISNIIAPGSGIYASAVQNAGGSAMETLNSDRNNIDKAVRTGVLKGTASALTEKITGGNLIAKGGLDNAIGRAIKGNVKSKIGQNLLYKGYQILGEMGEEQLENEAGYVIDKVINNKDMPDLKQRWEEATETAKMTGLTTIALNLVGLGGGSIDDVELSDMSTKDKKTIKDILERAKKTGTFKEGELADLVSKTDTDNKIAPIKDLDYLESAKKNNIDTNNETVRSIARITNERGIKASYDSDIFTNTNQNALWRIKTDENGNVTREVIINPNADTNKTLQNIAIHELTHDIEGTEQYNQIKDIILKYDKTKNGFEEARKSLAETYSKMYDKNSADFNELVDNEAVADILGNKLGDQDFINNLTMQNRTLGQKIYDWVVDKLNKLNGKLGYKSEKIYWADVKNKFENAFKQEYQNTNNQTSRFSIQTTADGNKKTFYDVTKIKRISQNRSTSANAFSTSLTNSNNSIAPIKDDVNTTKYSMQESENNAWQEYLNKNYKNTGRGEAIKDVKLAPVKNNVAPSMGNNVLSVAENRQKKSMNPAEIANLKLDDASTTPKLETKNYKPGNKQSSFTSNILNDAQFLNKDLRQEMGKDENVRYYSGITNAETLEKAYNSLKEGGEKETLNWFSKNEKNISAEDVAKGWILLKQYQDAGDYQGAVEVAKKMRQMGTSAGQAVQAYNIMARMSPEGMFYYAQSELNEAFNKMIEGKSKQWIEKNQDKFTLTPEETQTIIDTMKEVGEMEDGREKTVKLAEIQKLVSDKIPASAGQSIKAWMRISMLFNPKTQVRNVMGNSVVLPVNATADVFSGAMDKLISKKTGVRTTGVTKEGIKGYAKGFGKGLFESYDDFRKGINTRNVEGNRFEIGEGKSFKDKGLGKALNRVDSLLSFSLDAGDRGFYEASFTNSINNQLVLNNTTEVTQDMIDIATQEALQRTWQDDNSYTQTVLSIRKNLNKLNVKGYGLGDVLIPFAKTPANLTKAIVDYSPVGLVKTLALDARKFNNSLSNGQYSPQLQHKFVQNLGKGMAGSLLYVLGYGLAKAGIATGESDDDKDVKNFMKNSLGIGSYSIKVGDKSFSYDWAQPVATPLAIMTNYVKYSKDNPDASAINKAIKSLDIGTEQLLQQSFMESLNTVLNGTGTTMENLSKAILDLPARSIPTFSKQIADMVDETQRTTFEYGKPVQSAINSVISKIPFASKSLPASVDTLGHEVKKYGGNNNLWNVMFNPANTNKGQLSKAGKEIYDVYMQTGDTTIFPRTAPYYINSKGEKVNMTSQERNQFQRVTGKYVENSLNSLMKDADYKKLSNDKKAEIINEIVSDSYSKAKYDVLKIDSKEYEKKRNILKDVKPSSYYNYKFKTEGMKKDNEKLNVLVNANYTDKEKTALYENYILSSTNTTYPLLKKSGIDIDEYMKYLQQDFKSEKKDNGTTSGKTVAGSAKRKTYKYVNSMNISYEQKLLLLGTQYKLNNEERTKLYNYVKTLDYSQEEMQKVFEKLQGFTVYKDGRVTW